MSQDVLEVLVPGASSRSGLRDRVLLLRSFPNFVGLDEEGLTLLAEHARNRMYEKGTVIIEEGAPTESVHIIVEGQVTLTRKNTSLVLTSADGFGLLSVMAGAASGRVVADVDTRTLEIPAAAFATALEENFSLLRNGLRIMGETLLRRRGSLPVDPKTPPKVELGVYFEGAKSMAERLVELRSRAGPFARMNLDALVDLVRCAVEVRVPAGHVFWSVNDPSKHSLRVEYGRVRCTAADGRHVDVGSDFTLGVMDVWAAQPRSYEARAETEVIGYVVADQDFLIILEMHVQVGIEMLRDMARIMLD